MKQLLSQKQQDQITSSQLQGPQAVLVQEHTEV